MSLPNRKASESVAGMPAGFVRDPATDAKQSRRVENAIARRACGYKVALKKTYKLKRVEYDPETGKKVAEVETLVPGTEEVHVPGDLRAGAYWLNNRDPLHWKEDPSAWIEGEEETDDVDKGADSGGVVEIAAVALPESPPLEDVP